MSDSHSDYFPDSSRSPEHWSRSRIVFLALSGVLLLLLLWWASDVLLPFILAVILAYVLTPAVAYCERRRIPSGAAILLVYAVSLSSIYFSIAAIAPRVYQEASKLSHETPAMIEQVLGEWAPQAEQKLQAFFGYGSADATPGAPDAPAVQVQQLADGSFDLKLGTGFDVVQEGPNRWRVQSHVEPDTTLDLPKLMRHGIDESLKYAKRNALELIRFGQMLIAMVSRGVLLSFMTLMVAGYLIFTRDSIIDFFRSLVPVDSRRSFDRLLRRMDRGLSGVVRGQLLICCVNGVLSAIGFALFDLKYWPILAIIAGVMSIIPIFGSILSTVPAVLIGLTQDFWTALWVLLWVLAIHQVEANLLNPKIIGDAAKLHPVLVVFALLLGEHSYGLWGAVFAVPALSIVLSIFNHFRFELLPDAPPDSLFPPAPRR